MRRLIILLASVVLGIGACALLLTSPARAGAESKPKALSFTSTGVTFANLGILPPQVNGTITLCTDCQQTSVCAGGGAGAWAMRLGGSWDCAAGTTAAFGDLASYVGPIGLTGSSVNGTDAISHVSLNGVKNVQAFGALCSATTVSVTTVASSTGIVASGSIGDFKVGQSVVIPLAGATSTIATPTINSAQLDSYGGTAPAPSQYLVAGASYISGTCDTDSSSSTFANATCTSVYDYTLQAVAFNGSISAPSATVAVTGAPAVLSIDNAIVLQWTTDPAAVGYILKRCTGASCTPTANSIYHVFPNLPVGQTSGGNFVYADVGNPFGHSEYTLTNAAQAGFLNTTITAISGLNITLAVAPAQSGTLAMYHDDAPAFQAAAVAACSSTGNNCGELYAPLCVTGNPYTFGQAVSLYGFNGLLLKGTSGANAGTFVNWLGPIGGIVFNQNYAADQIIDGISVPSGSGNDTPGVVFDLDKYTGPTGDVYGPGGNPGGFSPAGATADTLRNAECGEAGICVNFGGTSNVDTNVVDHLHVNGQGGWVGIYSNSQETYNEQAQNSKIETRDFGILGGDIASFKGSNLDFESNIVDADVYSEGLSSIDFCVSEGAQMFLWWNNVTGGMTVSNCRIATNPGPTGYFAGLLGGTFSNNFVQQSPMSIANIAMQTQYGRTDTFIGNVFQYGLSSSNASAYRVQPYNLPFTDISGGTTQPTYTAINNVVGTIAARSAHDGVSAPISFDFSGPLSAWEGKKLGINCAVPLTIPTNFAIPPSSATCGTSPSQTDAYTVYINGSSVGTITTQTSCSTTPAAGNVVLGTATATTCAAGQRLEVLVPATASGNDLYLTLQALF